jgi:hypothetical protein
MVKHIVQRCVRKYLVKDKTFRLKISRNEFWESVLLLDDDAYCNNQFQFHCVYKL